MVDPGNTLARHVTNEEAMMRDHKIRFVDVLQRCAIDVVNNIVLEFIQFGEFVR